MKTFLYSLLSLLLLTAALPGMAAKPDCADNFYVIMNNSRETAANALDELNKNMVAADEDVTRANHEIYVEEATVAPGSDATIAVKLKTASNMVSAFQFDLTLPEGITLNGDETSAIRKGGLQTTSHHLDAAWLKSGACRVICYSTNNSKIKSLEGDAALIDIKVAPGVTPGTYPVKLTNMEMGRINGYSSVKPKNSVTYITVQFSDTPTGIQTVEGQQADGDDATYNVLGQKVKKLRPGQIGIKRGKKVIENEEGRK